jgi:hypothetical protein
MSNIDTAAALTKDERREQKRQNSKAIRQLRARGAVASAIPPPADRFQTVADWPREPRVLDVFGRKLRERLAERGYNVVAHDPASALGNVWLAFTMNGEREPTYVVVRDAGSDGPRGAELVGFGERLVQTPHPAIISPRDVFGIDEIGTAFIIDAPMDAGRILSLRQLIRWMHRDFKEEEIGRVFASVAAGLQFLQRRGDLPRQARVDCDTVFVFPDLTVRFLHPAIAQHGDDVGPHHAHRKLDKRLKQIQKKAGKGDAEAQQEQAELFDRFIIADLSLVLYEVMMRKLNHSSRHKMVRDAEKIHGTGQFSVELTQLLLDLLESGRTPKSELMTIDGIMARPVIQRFLDMLVTDAPTTGNPTLQGEALAEFMQGFDQHRLAAASFHPSSFPQQRSLGVRDFAAERERMARGDGHALSALRESPIERRNGVRIDIPGHQDVQRGEQQQVVEHPERQRMVHGEGHQLAPLVTDPITKRDAVRIDIPINTDTNEMHQGQPQRPTLNDLVLQDLQRERAEPTQPSIKSLNDMLLQDLRRQQHSG